MELQRPLPDHYHILAEELRPIDVMLREVLMYYPSPEGRPLEGISALIDEMNGILKKNFEALTSATVDLTTEVLLKGHAPRETVKEAVARIEEPLLNMLASYHDFWKRPFPPGQEDGQALFTNILRKPVEEYLKQLENVLSFIDNPGETPGKYDAGIIDLKSVFDIGGEVNAFHEWLTKTSKPEKKIAAKGLWVLLFALSAGFAMAFLAVTKSGEKGR
ncbi:MAG: hypothetical protein KBB65_02865 [Syntrophorhabdaceae bacterium]|nr:hypothetical protein [Syntrophorhabdaceae bacterium]